MTDVLIYSIVFLLGEFVAVFVFQPIKTYYGPKTRPLKATGDKGERHFTRKEVAATNLASAFKGILERLVVYVGLLAGFQSILVVFSALKIATRLDEHTRDQISNEYFFIGSLVSILLVLFYTLIAMLLVAG